MQRLNTREVLYMLTAKKQTHSLMEQEKSLSCEGPKEPLGNLTLIYVPSNIITLTTNCLLCIYRNKHFYFSM